MNALGTATNYVRATGHGAGGVPYRIVLGERCLLFNDVEGVIHTCFGDGVRGVGDRRQPGFRELSQARW